MKRRTFLTTLCSALTWPLAAGSQQRIARIGYLAAQSVDKDAPLYEAFRAGLGDLGYVEGKTIEILPRFLEQKETQLAALAQELVDLKVEVIATAASGVYAAHKVTKTVPIVVCAGGDLVALGLAESLAHPGGNITGSAILGPELVVKRTEFLKLVKPSIATLGLLMPRGSSATANYLRVLDAPTKALGLKVTLIEISNVDDCDRALAEGPGASVAALVVSDLIPDAAAAERRGLPTAGTFSFAKSGGLVGYGVDFPALYRRAAAFVDMILRGANAADIPIEQASRFKTIINLKTAAALGLDIPATVLAFADEVIE